MYYSRSSSLHLMCSMCLCGEKIRKLLSAFPVVQSLPIVALLKRFKVYGVGISSQKLSFPGKMLKYVF
jgi:hypothetical protein